MPGLQTMLLLLIAFLAGSVFSGLIFFFISVTGRGRKQPTDPAIHSAPTRLLPDENLPVTTRKPVVHTESETSLHHGYLIQKEGPHTGRKFKIAWDSVTLGRDAACSIVIPDLTVSVQHARVERRGNAFFLLDMVSENGTYLNGKKLLRPKEMQDFDEIRIGRTRFIFRRASGL